MIYIVDYEAGNQTSVKRALDHLGAASRITARAADLLSAEQIIFPGVGRAHSALETLHGRGLDKALKAAAAQGTLLLGICVGCQILLTHSEETDLPCLDLIPGICRKLQFEDPTLSDQILKVPHMGWNELRIHKTHPVLERVQSGDEVYFVHSYFPEPASEGNVLATCSYGKDFAAVIGSQNIIATQFHVEKSGPVGLDILRGFLEWDGSLC